MIYYDYMYDLYINITYICMLQKVIRLCNWYDLSIPSGGTRSSQVTESSEGQHLAVEISCALPCLEPRKTVGEKAGMLAISDRRGSATV